MSRRRVELSRDPEGFPQRHPFMAALMTSPDLSVQDLSLLLAEVFQGGVDAVGSLVVLVLLYFCIYLI